MNNIKLPAAISMVIANMIGVGVFTSVGYQLAGVPSAWPVLSLWIVGGILSICGALCYAELVAMLPRSGGEYHLLREAYHPLAGFMAGWISLIAGFAAPISLSAMAFAKYAQAFGLQAESRLLAASLVISVAALNLSSVKWLGRVLTGFTTLKVLLILAFIIGAIVLPGGTRNSFTFHPGDEHLLLSTPYAVSLVYVMFAYEGWNGAAYVAGDMDKPQRNVPLALIIGTLIVMALYAAVNAVFLWRTPWDAMRGQEEAALIAAKSIFGDSGGKFMGFLIAFGLVSTVVSMLLAGSRVNQRMGNDAPFLSALAKVNSAGTPWISVLVVAAVSLGMLLTGTFQQILSYVECLLLASSGMAVIGVIVLRWRKPDLPRPFRVPLYPLTPLVFAVMVIYMIRQKAFDDITEIVWGLLTLLVGVVVYFIGSKLKPIPHDPGPSNTSRP
ncbi:MAG: amino acid permease [Verrucomicrobiaceae bacterium]|nr:amino acid permease [Verrucomicrobiaceae bacterium]